MVMLLKTKLALINEAVQVSGTNIAGMLSTEPTVEEALAKLINAYTTIHAGYVAKYERYKASVDGTPIKTRSLPDFMKIDNHINNSFMSEIVDTKQGYMIGIPVAYTVQNQTLHEKEKSDAELKAEQFKLNAMSNKVKAFIEANNIHDLNMDTIKMMSICGTSSRLCYLAGSTPDIQADVRVVNIEPWETIFIYNVTGTEIIAAIRYYRLWTIESGMARYRTQAEVYDSQFIYYFKEQGLSFTDPFETGSTLSVVKFVFSAEEPMNPRPHIFGRVPLIEYANNKERQGDCDKVLSLIDAYDRSVSDLSSELEQFRLAYIALYGLKAEKEDIDKLRQTGMFEMTKDGKIEFITKKLDIDGIMKYFNRLENNIVRFAKSVNFKDENFYGNLSGVAIRYKLMQLEEKAMTTQVKFEVADKAMWKVLERATAIRSTFFDSTLIKRQFTRNIPVNMLEEARIQTELEGKVSTKTRLGVASFIENPGLEAQALDEERISNKAKGIEFSTGQTPVARMVDIESGGPVERNTNGTIQDI